MKFVKYIIPALAAAMTLAGCEKSQEPFATAGEDDFPRILNTDIEETTGGKPSTLPTISRDVNFTFETIVTPTKFTTVSWYIDGEKVFEGNKIDMPMIAGEYAVKIVATTTKGKETFRNCSLTVLPLDGDPALVQNEKNLWLQTGTRTRIEGSALEGVTKVYLQAGGKTTEIALVEKSNDAITVDVPADLEEGTYKLVLETADMKYGAGKVDVHNDKYVDPAVTEIALWEGDNALNWDAQNIKVSSDLFEGIPVGTEIKISFEKIDGDALAEKYWALRITTPQWGDDPEKDDILGQTDFGPVEGSEYVIVYDERRAALIKERGAMCLVGNGLKIKKISYMGVGGSAAGTVLWEGANALNWDAENIKVTADKFADLAEGSEIVISFDKIDGEALAEKYWALRITTPQWGDDPDKDDILGQTDFGPVEGNEYVIVYDARRAALIKERGAMCLVGNGLTIKKISAK